jgi:hypothetical protein
MRYINWSYTETILVTENTWWWPYAAETCSKEERRLDIKLRIRSRYIVYEFKTGSAGDPRYDHHRSECC